MRPAFLTVLFLSLSATAQNTETVRYAAAAGSSPTEYLVALPHMAYGGTWKTTLLVRNTGSDSGDVDVLYFGDDGKPLSVAIDGVSVTHTLLTVPPNGEREITPDPQTDPVAGWAALVYAAGPAVGISAQAVFLWKNSTEAVAPIISRQQAFCIPLFPTPPTTYSMPFDNTGGKYSGYAFANTTSTAVTLDLKFFDQSGQPVGECTQSLAGLGHDQFLLSSKLPALKDKKGTMQINGAGIVPLGFRFSPAGTFTTWLP